MKRAMKTCAGAVFFLTLSWACAPLLPYPTGEGLLRAQSEQPAMTLHDLDLGRRQYATTCASCHALHMPSELTTRGWRKIMVRMQVKAKIDDAKRDSILAYLTAMDTKDSDSNHLMDTP